MVRFYASLIVLFCASLTAFAQAPTYVRQTTQWFTLNNNINFGKKTGLIAEGNFRFVDNLQAMQHEFIAGLEYNVSKKISVIPIGYAMVWNYRYGEQPSAFANNEFRFWQRVQFRHHIGKFAIGHRLAIEERKIQRHHLSESGNSIDDGFINNQWRLRYRLNTIVPITSIASGHYFYLNVWDELNYSWGKLVTTRTPNQNRLFAGVGYQFSKSTSLQAGFLGQWIKKDNGVLSENNLGMMVQFNYAFSVKKTAK